MLAVLAAVAGLLVATERRVRVERAAVDLDLAGADAAGDLLGPLGVGRPHAARQAVGVSLAMRTASSSSSYGMIDSTGPKISSWAIVMSLRHVREHGRLHEVALVEAFGLAGAAGHELGALVDALLDVAVDALDLRLRRQRAEHRAVGERIGRLELRLDLVGRDALGVGHAAAAARACG